MTAYCRYHCRKCGSHFTSLRAFDRHREGPDGSDRACTFPDNADLVERMGDCLIGDPTNPAWGVTLYEHESASHARTHFGRENPSDSLPEGETTQ